MEQLTHFQPVFLTIIGVVFVAGIITGIQAYINRQVQPTETKVSSLDTTFAELKTEHRVEQALSHEHWNEVKKTMTDVGKQLHELTVGQAEMKVALFGHDGSNGIRGELRALRQDVKDISTRVGTLERE